MTWEPLVFGVYVGSLRHSREDSRVGALSSWLQPWATDCSCWGPAPQRRRHWARELPPRLLPGGAGGRGVTDLVVKPLGPEPLTACPCCWPGAQACRPCTPPSRQNSQGVLWGTGASRWCNVPSVSGQSRRGRGNPGWPLGTGGAWLHCCPPTWRRISLVLTHPRGPPTALKGAHTLDGSWA